VLLYRMGNFHNQGKVP